MTVNRVLTCLLSLFLCQLIVAAPAPLPRADKKIHLPPWPQGVWRSNDGAVESRFLSDGTYQERWNNHLYSGRWWLRWEEDPENSYRSLVTVNVDCRTVKEFNQNNTLFEYRLTFKPLPSGAIDMMHYKYGMTQRKSKR